MVKNCGHSDCGKQYPGNVDFYECWTCGQRVCLAHDGRSGRRRRIGRGVSAAWCIWWQAAYIVLILLSRRYSLACGESIAHVSGTIRCVKNST